MKRPLLLPLALLLCLPAFAQRPDSVSALIDSALRVMEHRALISHQLNWTQIRAEVDHRSRQARTDVDAMPALFWAFDQLQDKHGWITINDSTHVNGRIPRSPRTLSPGLKEALSKGGKINAGVVDGKYAYVSIPFFMGQTEEKMNDFAHRLQDSLCRYVSGSTKGIIIDLRLNGGGNMFPMVQGIANVLGNRLLTVGVDGRGRETGRFLLRDGRVVLHLNRGDSIVLKDPSACGDLTHLPVAVLIGPSSGSAAEQIAIAFTSRPNAVLVGERTAGFVTANNGFELPGRGNGIVIAEGLSMNAQGKLFADEVRPDIEVIGGDDLFDRGRDAKIRAAIRWLSKR